jgi:hypothetical protein
MLRLVVNLFVIILTYIWGILTLLIGNSNLSVPYRCCPNVTILTIQRLERI